MADLKRARKRLTDLVVGMRDPGVIHAVNGKNERMSKLQQRVLTAYARQVERIVDEVLQD
jgi:hypothetical protein